MMEFGFYWVTHPELHEPAIAEWTEMQGMDGRKYERWFFCSEEKSFSAGEIQVLSGRLLPP